MLLSLRQVKIICAVLFPLAASAQNRVFDSNGVPIHYVERGRGEALVLLHGNHGSLSTWIGSGVLDSLAKDYRVIALDLRGFGRSGKPHDPKQYGREMGLDVVRLLDELHIRKAHVAGYSMGAAITAQLLTTHADRFLTATLVGAAGRYNWTAEEEKLSEEEAVEWEQGRFGPGRYTAVLQTWPTDEPKPSEVLVKQRMDTALANPNFDRYAQAAFLRSRKDLIVTPQQAAAVVVPTLGIAGSADPHLAGLQELKKLRSAMTLVVIDGATHSGPRGPLRRRELVPAIRDFLRSQHQTPSP